APVRDRHDRDAFDADAYQGLPQRSAQRLDRVLPVRVAAGALRGARARRSPPDLSPPPGRGAGVTRRRSVTARLCRRARALLRVRAGDLGLFEREIEQLADS